MKAVFDTSSLIPLQVAGLVEELLDIAKILVPKTVTRGYEAKFKKGPSFE